MTWNEERLAYELAKAKRRETLVRRLFVLSNVLWLLAWLTACTRRALGIGLLALTLTLGACQLDELFKPVPTLVWVCTAWFRVSSPTGSSRTCIRWEQRHRVDTVDVVPEAIP